MLNFWKKKNEKNIEKKYVDGKKLSVIIPSYNHQKYIGQAIESVLNQTYRNLELIIIDDGSKDDSVSLIKTYQDSRIILIEQTNQGAHNAINRGLEMATGEYLAILNSDDLYEDNRFEIMINEMEKESHIGFMCSYIQVIDDKGNKLGVKKGWKNMEPWLVEHPEQSYQNTNDFKLNLLMTNFTSTTSNFLFKRNLYEKIGGMRNLRFAHDWDFALRAAEVTECMIIDKPLMRYRIHGSNTISTNRKWMLFEIAWMWAANLERFYGKLIFRAKEEKKDIFNLVESIHLQGNDKIFWIIKVFIDSQKALGIEKPEEILLEDKELRESLFKYINE